LRAKNPHGTNLAEWWDAHPEVVTALFLKAKKEGKIKRLPVVRARSYQIYDYPPANSRYRDGAAG